MSDAGGFSNGRVEMRGGGSTGTSSFGTIVLKMVGSCFGGAACDVTELACISPPVAQWGCCCAALEQQNLALREELTTTRLELLARESELLDKQHLGTSQELMLLTDQPGAVKDSADDVIRRSYSVELALASLRSPSPKRAKEEAARGAAHVSGNSPLDCSLHESRGGRRADEKPRAVYRGSLRNRAEAAEAAAKTGEAHAGARGSELISGGLEAEAAGGTAHVRADALHAPAPTATARSAAQDERDATTEPAPAVYRGSLWFESQNM